MTQELKKLREALRRVKYEAASLADAQVIAIEALSALQSAQPAEVSEEQIVAALEAAGVKFQRFMGGISGTKDCWSTAGSQDARKLTAGVRAILALRPQAVPMTDEQASELAKVGPVYAPEGKVTRTPQQYRNELRDARVEGIRLAENHHGITQRADGGEVA